MKYANERSRLFDVMRFAHNDDTRVFFTSDTHFNHASIIEFCDRPYRDVDEMNDALIANWNARVRACDIVFHLGDVAWGRSTWSPILARLNGHKHLIIGNHDIKNAPFDVDTLFESIAYQRTIIVNNRRIVLNHYPFLAYAGVYHVPDNQVWQLYGHVHSSPTSRGCDTPRVRTMTFASQYDVGVDNNAYTPVSFDEVERIIAQRQLIINNNN